MSPIRKALEEAFEPRSDEHSGIISLYRERFRSLNDVAKGKAKQDAAHVEIPGLNTGNRQTNETEELQSQLAEIAMILPVAGKFVPAE